MVIEVLSKHGKPLSRLVTMPSMLGDGLLERARSTGFALLGLTAAVFLGLVAFISYQGWPDILGGPIPGPSAEHGAVHKRTIAAGPTTFRGSFVHLHRATAPGASPRPHAGGSPPVGSRLAGSHEVATSPTLAGDQPTGHGAPGAQPVPQPPAAPTAPVPAPAPTVASSPSTAVQTGGSPKAGGRAKGKEHAQRESPGKDQGSAAKAKAPPHEPPAPPVKKEPPAPVEAGSPGKGVPGPPASEKAPDPGHGHGYGHAGK